jgi:hypothetical protein
LKTTTKTQRTQRTDMRRLCVFVVNPEASHA